MRRTKPRPKSAQTPDRKGTQGRAAWLPCSAWTSFNRSCGCWGSIGDLAAVGGTCTHGPDRATVLPTATPAQYRTEEKRVWSAAANVLSHVSDEAICIQEMAAAAAATMGRQSLSSPVAVMSVSPGLNHAHPGPSVDVSQGLPADRPGQRQSLSRQATLFPGHPALATVCRRRTPPTRRRTPPNAAASEYSSRRELRGGTVHCSPGRTGRIE
jgi:hypothetical protein